MTVYESHLNRLLNELERREAALLGWGTVDVGFTFEELEEAVSGYAQANDLDAEHLLRDLFDRALVLSFSVRGSDVYRTRMAETIRLLSRLKQLFPSHMKEHAPLWRSAPSLVSDYRLAIRPRRYPSRRRDLDAVRKTLIDSSLRLSDIQDTALEAIVGSWLLADFQVESARRILSDITTSRQSRGVIVGAGTGTGKTLAFYLPAFLTLVKSVSENPENWVRVLALYPRKELLKDQLTAALGRVLDLNLRLRRRIRPLSLGAFYGDTPYKADDKSMQWTDWDRVSEGYVCPYFRDPSDGSDLVWLSKDISKGQEKLHRVRDGRAICGPETIRLTRASLGKEPPDLLFTTTEMLNRNMGSAQNGRLLGVRTERIPRMVLLDEAHTYGGVHGAQVAYLLRRWRQAIRRYGQPHFTGLSATLADPVPFFADLTGLQDHTITSIRADHPSWEEEEAGNEYLVALRGDPFSGASLLSSTIQATMLMRRALDPFGSNASSQGLYGQRVFVFTDDLDVTNRLFDDIADAEGLWRRGGVLQSNPKKEPLAALRSPLNEIEETARFEAGQSWRFVNEIGHEPSLVPRLHLDRVSSQDAGIASNADIVIATASLEVGYDDDRVGAVIQHKAPRETAAFVQRKGRAGRPPRMRPWTCVVLSDYGRDRIAYQNYDALFDPEIKPQYLPLANRYVLRMQATYTVLEWIADQLLRGSGTNGLKYFDLWRALRKHGERYARNHQEAYLTKVRELIDRPHGGLAKRLQIYLSKALAISEDEVLALLWEPPRAILTTTLPTLLRRLESNWSLYGDGVEPPSRQPLPEFIPATLFSDLNLPEVTLEMPSMRRGSSEFAQDDESMSVERTLRDYAPGRVSRRFGYRDRDIRHWVPLPAWSEASVRVPVGSFLREHDPLGEVQYVNAAGTVEEVPVLRPIRLALAAVPDEVLTASNARPRWHTQILPPSLASLERGQRQPVSDKLTWHQLVEEVRFYTHLTRTPVEVRRFTLGSDATVLSSGANRSETNQNRVETWFDREGQDVALGFAQTVDAIGFSVKLPDVVEVFEKLGSGVRRSLRTEYFRNQIATADGQLPEASVFQRGWFQQALLGTLVERAHADEISVRSAFERLSEEGFGASLQSFLGRILEVQMDPDSSEIARGRHGDRLADLCQNEDFVAALVAHAPLLWREPDEAFFSWLSERMRTTVGAALVVACAQLTPGRSEDGLLLDFDAGPQGVSPDETSGEDVIWISEASLGGNGLVEAILTSYVRDPRRFFALADQILQGSDLEFVARELPRALELFRSEPEIAAAAEKVRYASGLANTKAAHSDLRTRLSDHGVLCTHAVYAAMSHRLLQPGSGPKTERLLTELYARWLRMETISRVEIEPKVFAHIVATDEDLTDLYPPVSDELKEDLVWRSGLIYSLLWTRGGMLRSSALRPYNPFATFLSTDRVLALALLPERGTVVTLGSEGWREVIEQSLREHGTAYLEAPAEEAPALQAELLSFVEQPLETGFLHVHAAVEGIGRNDAGYRVTLTLPEAIQ